MATKTKDRVHREWFRTVSLGGRKSCPSCGTKLVSGESVWSWGEYLRAKWRTVKHFCKVCWEDRPNGFDPARPHPGIKTELQNHAGGCGCRFELVGYRGEKLPEWLKLEQAGVCSVE